MRHGKELGGNNFGQDPSFFSILKPNISSHFGSQDVVSAFSIFDPKETPKLDSSEYSKIS